MTRKKLSGLEEAILEMVEDLRGGAIKEETAQKITLRILGEHKPARPGDAVACFRSSSAA